MFFLFNHFLLDFIHHPLPSLSRRSTQRPADPEEQACVDFISTHPPPPPSPPPQAEPASAQQDVSAAEQQLAASADTVLSLEEAMRAAEKRYAFVQGLRQYLAVLCDFLKVSIGRLCVQQLDSSPSSHHP